MPDTIMPDTIMPDMITPDMITPDMIMRVRATRGTTMVPWDSCPWLK